jgi:transcriptional regulator with XRE-family HTH domain
MTNFNHNKLKGRLVEYGYGRKDLAELLGVSQSTISQKLNSVRDFSTSEMLCIMEWLDIPKEEIVDYFFTPKVEK